MFSEYKEKEKDRLINRGWWFNVNKDQEKKELLIPTLSLVFYFKNLACKSRKDQKFSTMNKYYFLTLKKIMKMEGLRKKYIGKYIGAEDQDKF